MKIRKLFLAAGLTAVMVMAGCGQKAAEEDTLNQEAEQETEQVEETEQESGMEDAQTEAETVDGGQPEEEGGAQEETEASSEGSAEGQLYEDNFAVDEDAVVAFGEKIQEAVAAKDMEALADLTAFPVYVGLPDTDGVVETREDFLALGAEQVLTDELVSSVEQADLSGQQPSMAGFVVADESGRPNIIFGVVEGKLAITGINY